MTNTNLMDNPSEVAVTDSTVVTQRAHKRALQLWAEKHEVKPTKFAERMKYSYNHAYQLLRGDLPVTAETIGRLALYYGSQAMVEFEQLAAYEQNVMEVQNTPVIHNNLPEAV